MLVLTLPIIHPLILELGYDSIWFGVVIVIVIEMGPDQPAGRRQRLRRERHRRRRAAEGDFRRNHPVLDRHGDLSCDSAGISGNRPVPAGYDD